MERMRAAVAAFAVLLCALTLAGCSSDDDALPALEERLAQVDGVGDAWAGLQHPGAPWNTRVAVWLFVDDVSVDGLVAATRGAAPVLADDPDASGRTVHLAFVEGEPSDYDGRSAALAAEVTVLPEVYTEVGIAGDDASALTLSPEDIAALAG